MIVLCKIIMSALLGDTLFLALKKQTLCCLLTCREGRDARTRRQPLAQGQQQTEAHSLAFCKEWNVASSLTSLGSRAFPSEASDETTALADTLTAVCEVLRL